MADFDLFEMVGLAFDPPETNAKQIKKKIDQKINELGSALGRETQQINRDNLQAQKDYLESIVAQIISPDGKKLIDQDFIKSLAEKKTELEKSALQAKVKLFAMGGKHTVTAAAMREDRKETKLSIEHVKEIYLASGFEVVELDLFAAYPKFPANVDRIHSELAALRRTEDPNPNGADTSVAVDLYAFAAYLENDTGNISMYRRMDREQLWSIFNLASLKFSQRNDNLGKLCGSLSAAAKKCVFDSDDNQEAYKQYLIYCSDELSELFTTLKKCKKIELETEGFAEHCIKIISKYFPEYSVALAIYNKEGNCSYEPPRNRYIVKCNYCDDISEYESEESAIKVNLCKNCKKTLFKKCDKCGKNIPIYKDMCPHCGYVFASVAMFSKLYQQAEAAFRRSDFNAARQYLFQAQSAAPGEKTRIDALSNQIEKEEGVLKEPINRLRQLIAERRFNTARIEMGGMLKKFPNLNISEFEKSISCELSKADGIFASAEGYPSSKKADVCVTILMQCVDYQPALAFVRATRPLPCGSIKVTPASSIGIISISWNHSSEQGVSYRLVRKAGTIASTSENDGEILIDRTTATSFKDENVIPGQLYTYSIFTVRYGIYSSPVSGVGTLYTDVKNCHVAQRGAGVRITWDAPNNSRGATIIRACEGKTVTLTENAYGSYEDSGTQYGKSYNYKVLANYDRNNKSIGVECTIVPFPTVDSFSIRSVQVKENIFKISWNIKQVGIDLRVMVNGILSVESKSDDGAVQVTLPKETFCKISVLAHSGGKWISSENTIEVNTYTSCGIDKKATELEENMTSGHNGVGYRIFLKIHLLGEIPSNAIAFYYTVRTTKSENKWASLEDIGKASDIQQIFVDSYQKQGFIPYQTYVIDETSFFISVFTCYSSDGKEMVSEPKKLKIDRPLNANLFWAVSYDIFGGFKLTIELSGNKPLDYVPELLLCVASQFISSKDDKDAQIVMRIPSVELEIPMDKYNQSYQIKTDIPTKLLKKCNFFLFEQDTSCGDTFSLRWKQGFSGKV